MKHLKEVGFAKERMAELITTEVEDLVKLMKKKEGTPIDCAGLFDVPVINTLWQMMAGSRFDHDDKRLAELLTLIHLSFRMLDMSGGLLNQMPFLRYLAPGSTGYSTVCHILDNLWIFLRVSYLFFFLGGGIFVYLTSMVISRPGFYPPGVGQTNQLLTLTSPSLSGAGKSQHHMCETWRSGHPSKYHPCATSLNFVDRTRTGVFNVPQTLAYKLPT
ncbi:hypothetical protein WDU94_001645 [Cyamophila willieti]